MTDANDRDPYALFADWLEEAGRSEPNDPNAMALATADAAGVPSVRMVLLKGVDARGFVFYTNTESRKGEQLLANRHAALCFHWKTLRRSVRVEGRIEQVTDAEADAYFESRPRESRIGAWASQQSRPLEGRWELEKRVAQYAAKFAIGTVPRPPHWTGFRVLPARIEFWQDRPFRLHERVVYRPADPASQGDSASWTTERLYP
ncbi:pyridoxamine 5'-phosphate oxidase [Azospirillum agricola]|uniref:pyridoxamine 5'-phosphate oxidase n=1 Tax=Azospirillum agricola TaxID=1720247 RepID=UPI001AE76007|nr:pyridoxamine 5'-phosphate oxidase [Azospirillum agricola]MBP2227042.1 pyridoxamine 5'-phosphate oxidase [Azospirillum agricola]